jgi:tetratricopeptide (TPR) repeat protein
MRFVLAAALLLLPEMLLAQNAVLDSVRALLRTGARDQALAYALAQARAMPDDPWAHHAVARASLAREDFDAAVVAAERSVQLAPRESWHQYVLGESYVEKAGAAGGLSALGTAKKGKAALERAVELNPDNLDAREWLVGYLLEAPGIAGGSKAEAGRHATEMARRNVVRGRAAQLRVAVASGEEYDVTYAFEQGLALLVAGRDSANIIINALFSAALQVEKDAIKEKLTARLYAGLPDNVFVRYARARLWVIQGKNLEEAVRVLQGYVALPDRPAGAPGPGGAHWRLGQAYEKLRREPEALTEYRRAVELMPQFEDARKDLDRLERKLARR